MPPQKSVTERIFQATIFEILAVTLSTVIFAWVLRTGWLDMGAFSLANSLIAVLWNVAFNAIFDRVRRMHGFAMTVPARIAHAIGFEAGLVVATLPLAMWWLDLGFRTAVAFETAGVLFFLCYTYAYHWAYDALRAKLCSRRPAVE